jgi:hypothetical protein
MEDDANSYGNFFLGNDVSEHETGFLSVVVLVGDPCMRAFVTSRILWVLQGS